MKLPLTAGRVSGGSIRLTSVYGTRAPCPRWQWKYLLPFIIPLCVDPTVNQKFKVVYLLTYNFSVQFWISSIIFVWISSSFLFFLINLGIKIVFVLNPWLWHLRWRETCYSIDRKCWNCSLSCVLLAHLYLCLKHQKCSGSFHYDCHSPFSSRRTPTCTDGAMTFSSRRPTNFTKPEIR